MVKSSLDSRQKLEDRGQKNRDRLLSSALCPLTHFPTVTCSQRMLKGPTAGKFCTRALNT